MLLVAAQRPPSSRADSVQSFSDQGTVWIYACRRAYLRSPRPLYPVQETPALIIRHRHCTRKHQSTRLPPCSLMRIAEKRSSQFQYLSIRHVLQFPSSRHHYSAVFKQYNLVGRTSSYLLSLILPRRCSCKVMQFYIQHLIGESGTCGRSAMHRHAYVCTMPTP